MELTRVNGLYKRYGGSHALKGADLIIEPGRIIGLLGPNGSGKTTLMKVIAGLLCPNEGEIIYPNRAARGVEAKCVVSFMPDALIFPGHMKVRDAYCFYKDMYPDYNSGKAEEMAALLGLEDKMDIKVNKLSKGMKDRLALGLTFSRSANLYLLDEPLGGIDPVGKSKIIDGILAMQLKDASIVISTHLVKDIERIFDSVFFISHGKIIFSGDCDRIREEKGKTVEEMYLEVFENEAAV